MKFYQSTRGGARATAWEAILEGIAPDGGLYTPEEFPPLNIEEMLGLSAMDVSTRVLTALLDGFSKEEMGRIVREGYAGKFETDELTPLVKVGDAYVLELFCGPTSAFKDVALSLLPRLMTASRDKAGAREEIAVLTATSGDTPQVCERGRAGDGIPIPISSVILGGGSEGRAHYFSLTTSEK